MIPLGVELLQSAQAATLFAPLSDNLHVLAVSSGNVITAVSANVAALASWILTKEQSDGFNPMIKGNQNRS